MLIKDQYKIFYPWYVGEEEFPLHFKWSVVLTKKSRKWRGMILILKKTTQKECKFYD